MTGAATLSPTALLEGAARTMLGADVGVAAVDITGPLPGLMRGETAAMAHAVPARRREFAAGRAAARDALFQIGGDSCPIPMGPDRAPVWQDGVTGSITHSGSFALAAVGLLTEVQSIGIDLELSDPLDEELLDTVLGPMERDELAPLSDDERGARAKLIFSAKECAFKCQYAITGAMLEFTDLRIVLEPEAGVFHVGPAAPGLTSDGAGRMSGRFALLPGLVLTTMVLRR